MFVYGHRGAAGEANENTLAAIRAGIAAGCDGIEIDVRALAGAAVVIHDETLERTTTGRGRLADYDLAALRALDAGGGERIPLLAEVVAVVTGHARLNVELKDAAVVPAVVADLAESDDVLVSSFLPDALADLERAGPALPRALNVETGDIGSALALATELRCVAIHVPVSAVDADLAAAVHVAGFRLGAFTCNDLARARELQAAGCDALFTDIPATLIPALGTR